MRKAYFTIENLHDVSSKMFQELSDSHGSKMDYRITKSTALIVTDMQNYFLDEKSHAFVPSATAILPGIKKLCELFLAKDMTVIFTRHTNNKDNAGIMSFWWKDLIRENTKESEIYSDLLIEDSIIVRKHQYDAFYNTNLNEVLKERKIEQLVITGVLTHLCCETTARTAFVNEYKVLFPIDGTATYRKKFHKSTLRNLSHGFAFPVLMEELITKVELYEKK